MDSRFGAIVLCGGQSQRMQHDKAWLPFGCENLLQRVVRLVGKTVPAHNIVVVAAAEQVLPPLPKETRIVRDAEEAQGPLPAMLAGLCELPEIVEAAFMTGCDAPFIKPAVVEWLFWRLELVVGEHPDATQYFDAVVPADGKNLHPLCGVYRTTCRVGVAAAARAGITSLRGVVKSKLISARLVSTEELRGLDPQLDVLVNCNTPEEYEQALARAGASP